MPGKKAAGSSASKKRAQARRATSITQKSPAARKKAGAAARRKAPRKSTSLVARRAASAPASAVFKRASREAKQVLSDPRETQQLSKAAEKKLAAENGFLGEAVDDFRTLVRLIRAYAKKEYRELPWPTMVSATAAVVYFVWPADLIPDALPGVGQLDDAVVALFVVKVIQADLADFLKWEEAQAKKSRARTSKRKSSPAARRSGATTRNATAGRPVRKVRRKQT
jgi:uncharacterized membrane protein YkvA (DUF1232 family)